MIKILQNNNFVVYLQTYLATLQPLWLKVRWVSGLNQQFAKLPYGITVPGVRIPLSPLEKPGLPESGLFRSPARGELARQGDRERESAEAATAARLFKQGPARRGHRGKGLRSKANPRPRRACSSGRQRAGKRRGSDSCQAFQKGKSCP